MITGYVYNDYGRAVGNVRLVVEPLDAGGQPTDRRIFYVNGMVPAFGRAYFSFTAPGDALGLSGGPALLRDGARRRLSRGHGSRGTGASSIWSAASRR